MDIVSGQKRGTTIQDHMNNHVNMYRVEHTAACFPGLKEQVGVGPYTYTGNFSRTFDIAPNSALQQLCECLRKFEPRPQRYGKESVCPNKTLPASFNYIRPGPREDPYLREWFKDTYLKGKANGTLYSNQMAHEPILFGFDSMEQLERWFFDKKEFELLQQNGFKVVKRRVKQIHIVPGHAQCLWKIKELIAT